MPWHSSGPLPISVDYVAFMLGSETDDSFTAQLLRLIARSDPVNQGILAQAFPREFAAFRAWQASPDGRFTPPP
jgi:hypothetical protein